MAPDVARVQDAVRRMYADVACSAEGKFRYATGRAGALGLGYDPVELAKVPDEIVGAFCGVGNPFSLGPLRPGDALVDVGCGAGIDLIIASRILGNASEVHGLDLTPEMVAKARAHLTAVGVANASVELGCSEAMPYDDGSFDVMFSNGVFNLSPCKEETFREAHRVLRSGGRLQFADIVLREALDPEIAGNLDAWAA